MPSSGLQPRGKGVLVGRPQAQLLALRPQRRAGCPQPWLPEPWFQLQGPLHPRGYQRDSQGTRMSWKGPACLS